MTVMASRVPTLNQAPEAPGAPSATADSATGQQHHLRPVGMTVMASKAPGSKAGTGAADPSAPAPAPRLPKASLKAIPPKRAFEPVPANREQPFAQYLESHARYKAACSTPR